MTAPRDLGIQPLVRHAWHAVGMARTAEALMLGAGLGLLAAAAAIASGAPAGDPAIWMVAALAALPMIAAWLIEMRPQAGSIARRVDQRLHLGGAFLTAWEVEHEQRAGELGSLLGRGLRRHLRLKKVLAAAVPNSPALLIVPMVGVAALVLALDARPPVVDPMGGLGGVLGSVAGALGEAHDASIEAYGDGEVTEAEVERLQDLARDTRALSHAAERVGQDPQEREQLARQVEDLVERIEQAARSQEGRRNLAQPLERALALSDAASLACGQRPESGSAGGGLEGHAGGDGGADSGLAQGDRGDDGASDGAEPLANDGAQGTMSAHSGPEPVADDGSSAPQPVPEAADAGGVALGPWWPERHAGVVRRFVERRRDEASDTSQ